MEDRTMRAVVQHRYGSPDVLTTTEIERPAIASDQVLLRMQAVSLNPFDWHEMTARPFFMRMMTGLLSPKQPVRGVDIAGRVEEIGSAVTRFQPGDEVFGWCRGALAEFVAAGEAHLVRRPARITPEQAASVPIAGFTALQGLRDLGRLQAGDKVLIIGASGGVGTFAIQIAKALGAEVTGVCSTRNQDLVRSIGADHVIDYNSEDATDGDYEFDVIFQLAGTESPARLRRILAPDGTLVLSSGEGRFSGIDRIVRAKAAAPFVSQRLVTWVAGNRLEDLETLAEMMESGQVTPVIDRVFPMDQAVEAMRYVEAAHTQGKVVVTP
ncbi:MAG: NAD(P)-dependent alcohol dehydrogenase [Acidimicrobiia bacterium]